MWLFDNFFSSILQIWCVKVRISRSIKESPLDLEITIVDCNMDFASQVNPFIPAFLKWTLRFLNLVKIEDTVKTLNRMANSIDPNDTARFERVAKIYSYNIAAPGSVSIPLKWQVSSIFPITKVCLYNFDPHNTNFLYSKTGVHRGIHYFSYFAKIIDCGYSLEPPLRGGSNEYPQSILWAEIWKNIRTFCLKIFLFGVVKFSIYLSRCVFVMPE